MFLQQSVEATDQLSPLNPNPLQSTAAATRKRAYKGQGSGGGAATRRGAGRSGAVLGEIVEVQGGHIIRSTGRKDRHSKVSTAKGPRDRRVRLSAHTAIQFYDVQDRLGYDRPSKAVDWLINKAKSAIDELDELPPWKPTATSGGKSKSPGGDAAEEEAGGGVYIGNNEESSSILPPSMDSDSIADIKSFLVGGEASPAHAAAVAAPVQFSSYPALDMQSRRGSSQSEDLKLSLQSFENPIIIQSRNQQSHQNQEEEHQSTFPEADQIGFDSPPAVTGWDDTQPADLGRFQRLIGWNLAGGSYSGGSRCGSSGGSMFIPPPQPLPPPLLFGHGVGQATHFFTQGGPLQSNNNNTSVITTAIKHHHQAVSVHPVSRSGIGFASTSGEFSSCHIPARIHGDHEDEQDGNAPNKPSSIASSSRC